MSKRIRHDDALIKMNLGIQPSVTMRWIFHMVFLKQLYAVNQILCPEVHILCIVAIIASCDNQKNGSTFFHSHEPELAGMEWAFASHLGGRHITSDMWPDLMQWMRLFLKDHDPEMKENYVNSNGTLDEYFLVSLFGTVLFQDLWKILVVY